MLTARPILSKTLLWTPSWTNVTLGASFRFGEYTRFGRWIEFQIQLTLGSGFAITGQPSCDLPVPADFAPSAAALEVALDDAGTGFYEGGVVTPTTISTGALVTWQTSTSYAQEIAVSSTVPFTWAATDRIEIVGHYLAASAL